jgi:class 3 adenylate cyclase
MIPNETPRGRLPPAWFGSLSGIERARLISQVRVPVFPFARLFGIRITHVVPGGATVVSPAAESMLQFGGHLNVLAPLIGALEAATITALPPGSIATPLKVVVDSFRPAHPQPGNLIARARVLNSSRLFVFVEARLEDSEGRHIAQGTLQSAVEPLDPAPPKAPESIPHVEEPVYETPDPHQRSPHRDETFSLIANEADAARILRELAPGSPIPSPLSQLLGATLLDLNPGTATIQIPASEWFSLLSATVSTSVIACLAELTAQTVALTVHEPGQLVLANDELVRFIRPIPTDDRPIVAHGTIIEHVKDRLHIETKVKDADGRLAASYSATFTMLEESRRPRRNQETARRVLATLLFTDIVDSTKHAERLGDAKWRKLLNEQRAIVRAEISQHNGTEIDTAGDGFFVRFESPAQAIEAARAASRAVRKLDIELRAGVHTGECEIEKNRPTGMAVHLASRIQSFAAPSEILVSSTVRELATGAGLRFADRGEHEFKGVPEKWRVYAVDG